MGSVGVRSRRGARGGDSGKLTGDPAIRDAAVAVLLGSDQRFGLDFLTLDDDERPIAVAVLNEVARMRTNETDYLAHKIAKSTWGG